VEIIAYLYRVIRVKHKQHIIMKTGLEIYWNHKVVKHFNETARDKFWNRKGNKMKMNIGEVVQNLIRATLDNPHGFSLKTTKKAVGNYNEILCGIQTQMSIGKKVGEITRDSIIGNTLVGETTYEEILKGNLREDNMFEWIYDNLWLWMASKVERSEHHKNNILRNKSSLSDKLDFKHYVNTSKIILTNK